MLRHLFGSPSLSASPALHSIRYTKLEYALACLITCIFVSNKHLNVRRVRDSLFPDINLQHSLVGYLAIASAGRGRIRKKRNDRTETSFQVLLVGLVMLLGVD